MAIGIYDGGLTSISYIKPRLVWESVPDAATNSSAVWVTLYAQNTSSGSGYVDGTGAWQIIIDGQYSGKIEAYVKVQAGQGWTPIVSWHTQVMHESDGTKSITIQATGGISSSSVWKSTKASTTIELDRIVKEASSATVNSPMAVDGTAKSTVSINASASGLYHKVVWQFGDRTHEAKTSGSSASFTVPTSWLDQIPTATSGTASVTVTTYADSGYTSQIGEPYTVGAKWTVPASVKPKTASGWAVIAPVNSANVPAGIYAAGISKAKATFDTSKVTAQGGTTIKSYKISYGGTSYASPYTTPVLSAGTATITATVTDARGRTTSEALTATVYAYANPSLSGIEVYRSTSQGNASPVGTYAAVQATANISALGGANSYAMTAQIKEAGGSYGAAHAMTSGEQLFLAGLDTAANYYVLITLEDALGNRATSETLIAAGESGNTGGPSFLGMKLRDGGDGAGFGCDAEDGYLSCAYTNGLKIVNGKLTIGETTLSEAQLQALLSML